MTAFGGQRVKVFVGDVEVTSAIRCEYERAQMAFSFQDVRQILDRHEEQSELQNLKDRVAVLEARS